MALPRRGEGGVEDLVDPLTAFLTKPGHVCRPLTGPDDPGCAGGFTRLNLLQTQALVELHDNGGLFLQGPLGCGKTGVALFAPTLLEAQRALYIVPGSAISSGKVFSEINILREHWNIVNFQSVSYQKLAREEQEFFFFEPPGPYDLIILDEAHYCRNAETAVTKRIHRLREKAGQEITITRVTTGQTFRVRVPPCPRMAVMTATPVKDSIRDTAHTMEWALNGQTPLPRDSDVDDWAGALDAEPLERHAPGALTVFSGGKDDLELVRKGVGEWIFNTPGCISSSESYVSAKLSITLRDVPLTKVEDDWFKVLRGDPLNPEEFPGYTTPDGDVFTEAAELWRHACSMSLGYYTIWWRHEGFRECLSEFIKHTNNDVRPTPSIEKKQPSRTGDIERQILNAFAHTTERDNDLVKAVEHLMFTGPANISPTSRISTESRRKNTISSMPSSRDSVISVSNPLSDVEVDSWLTTIINQGKSGDSSVLGVTARLDSYLTMLRRLPGLLPILLDAFEATKAPQEWRTARYRWHSWAREILKASHTIDTLAQLATAVYAGKFDNHEKTFPQGVFTLREILEQWREIEPSFIPNSVPVWIGDTSLKYAAKWLEDGGIVWTGHRHFGIELSKRTGCPYFSSEGMSPDGQSIVDTRAPGIIASTIACGAMFNLQSYNRNLIASIWPVGLNIEQTLGRTHRQGQKRDVTAEWMMSCREQLEGFSKAASCQAPMMRDLMRIPSRLCGARVHSEQISTKGWAFASQNDD